MWFAERRKGETPKRTRQAPRLNAKVEALEGRQLLALSPVSLSNLATQIGGFGGGGGAAFLGRFNASDPGREALLNALNGGAGSEFTTLIRRQVPNLSRVIRGFVTGQRSQFTTNGLAVKTPRFEDTYTGVRLDQLSATAAGAILLPDGRLELAGIMRGPIDDSRLSVYSFGIDRGGALTTAPNRPGIRYDALVTVSRDASGVSGTVFDLETNTTTPIARRDIQIVGPTLRVFLSPSALPSNGLPLNRYRFALWTSNSLSWRPETIASFVPEADSILIGTLQGRTSPRRRR